YSRESEPSEALELVLPGRALNQFTLNGTGHLVFENINQRRLEIKLNGRGDVRGTGTAEDVDLRIAAPETPISAASLYSACGSESRATAMRNSRPKTMQTSA